MESLRVMPPAPVINRTAREEGVLDGIVIPKGTMLYIPVSISRLLELQELCVSHGYVSKDSCYQHVESYVGRRCRGFLSRKVAESPGNISSKHFHALVHCRSACLHWKNDGDLRNEGDSGVSDPVRL